MAHRPFHEDFCIGTVASKLDANCQRRPTQSLPNPGRGGTCQPKTWESRSEGKSKEHLEPKSPVTVERAGNLSERTKKREKTGKEGGSGRRVGEGRRKMNGAASGANRLRGYTLADRMAKLTLPHL